MCSKGIGASSRRFGGVLDVLFPSRYIEASPEGHKLQEEIMPSMETYRIGLKCPRCGNTGETVREEPASPDLSHAYSNRPSTVEGVEGLFTLLPGDQVRCDLNGCGEIFPV